jgi:tetratricopeptide (TPR) repeat protein
MDFAYALLGYIYLHRRQYEKAITAGERAIALNPNGADAHAWLGHILCVAGRPAEGLALLKKAIRLSPIPPNWYLNYMAMAYRMMERYDESLEVSKQALHLNPDDLYAHLSLAITYGLLDREAEAREAAAEVLRIDPFKRLKKGGNNGAQYFQDKVNLGRIRFMLFMRGSTHRSGIPAGIRYDGQAGDSRKR